MSRLSRSLDYDKLPNIRDLGGMTAEDGKRIAEGKLIRSGHLSDISEEDQKNLGKLAEIIVDFRTDAERREKPDVLTFGAEYFHIPIFDKVVAGITRESSADQEAFSKFLLRPSEAKQYMCDIYREFVFSDHALAQYAKFVQLLLPQRDKAILWHCTAGKDRAGVASVIIEEILGVPREQIFEDYLSTNVYLEADLQNLTMLLTKQMGEKAALAKESLEYLLLAKEEYLQIFYEAAAERFGDFKAYLRTGLCLSAEDMRRMRENYLE